MERTVSQEGGSGSDQEGDREEANSESRREEVGDEEVDREELREASGTCEVSSEESYECDAHETVGAD
ncbi:MAG: hypothetical protein M3P30_11625 [Chloroflexota bacterium]|nr:hypothetical protein [Chloroflexota bacterium]